MPDFNKPRFARKPFGNKPFGGRPSFGNQGGFSNGPKQMFDADCAKCGNTCQVPFRPNGTKPVYCNNCFVKDDSAPRRDFAPRPSFNNDRSSAPAPRPDQAFNDLKAELRVVNANLERLINIMTPIAHASKAEAKAVEKAEAASEDKTPKAAKKASKKKE